MSAMQCMSARKGKSIRSFVLDAVLDFSCAFDVLFLDLRYLVFAKISGDIWFSKYCV